MQFRLFIVLYFIPQIIVECIVKVNLADNLDSESSKSSPTFLLVQESENYLYFQWTPFDKQKSDSLKLNLNENRVTRQLTTEETYAKFPTIGLACINEEYTITNHILKAYLFDNTLSKRKINYKRTFRVQNTKIRTINKEHTYITWQINENYCNPDDLIIIFKKDSTGFHRMHIVNVDETNFHIDEALQKQEEIIITSYHENRFGLFELVVSY
ncbi:unnamed protein product [Schistosoma rodhaini]|uniref:Uncharacterized protein n=1 Tax=Schistosoma rodhaini TaxID=6188 RepID=A0AA85GGW9_9TREM|nr:unnamed protein product [Schistosoma rodhaini]